MTGEQYKKAIDHLGMSQAGSGRFFGVHDDTPRKWISGRYPVPSTVEMLLLVMIHYSLTPENVMAIVHQDRVASH